MPPELGARHYGDPARVARRSVSIAFRTAALLHSWSPEANSEPVGLCGPLLTSNDSICARRTGGLCLLAGEAGFEPRRPPHPRNRESRGSLGHANTTQDTSRGCSDVE